MIQAIKFLVKKLIKNTMELLKIFELIIYSKLMELIIIKILILILLKKFLVKMDFIFLVKKLIANFLMMEKRNFM